MANFLSTFLQLNFPYLRAKNLRANNLRAKTMKINQESHSTHISQKFNQELEEIRSQLLEMGGLVEQQIHDAIQSLTEGDTQLAKEVCEKDHQVNQLQLDIDEQCTKILARRQPAASDLRLVLAVIRATADLERIGDESSKIAKATLKLAEEGTSPRGYIEARHLGNQVRKMVQDALHAFARFDTAQALAVLHEDKNVDLEYKTATRSLITFMMEDPRSISQVMNIMWVLRSLERVGDHASNLAEYVIYLVEGQDVRYTKTEVIEAALTRPKHSQK